MDIMLKKSHADDEASGYSATLNPFKRSSSSSASSSQLPDYVN